MDWKNQLTKTPYLVLFIVLITVGVGTASALITITLSGNVIITDNLTVGTDTLFVDSSTDKVGVGTLNPDSALHVVGGGSDNTPDKQGIQLTGSDTAGNVGIELTGDDKIPYIDFQNDVDGTDFDGRIILRGNDTLSVEGADWEVKGGLKIDGAHSGLLWNSRVPTDNTITTIDDGVNLTQYTSITIGVDGNPVISYYDGSPKLLKVAKCSNPSCTSTTTTTVDAGGVGQYSSITIGVDGNPVISYFDASLNFDLKVAKCSNPSCTSSTTTTVDAGGIVGLYTSITIGVDGNPVISYYDDANGDLKVAKCSNPSCTSSTITTVDAGGSVGSHTSITIGVDGNPVISYFDSSPNLDLKVAKCSNPSCTSSTITTVDAGGDFVGRNTSITIGVDGNPVISYYDDTNGELKVAKCNTPSCTSSTTTTVDAGGNVGRYTSITIGVDGNLVISYFDVISNLDLKVAKCNTPSCTSSTTTTVDAGGNVGSHTSITIGVDGNPVISYSDDTNGDLKVIKCANPYCIPNWIRR